MIVDIFALLLRGLKESALIFVLTLLFSIPLASFIAFLKIKNIFFVKYLISIYITVLRGTPLILQLLAFYFLPSYVFGIRGFGRFSTVIFSFSINYAAYFAEIFRSGYISIPNGQYEASKILGFSKSFTFMHIYIPQIIKRILPSFSGEVITLVKDTALASTLGVVEMFTIAQKTSARLFSIVPIFTAGAVYLALNSILTFVFSLLEKKYSKYSI